MATEMLHAGIPIVIVSRRLDHRRVSTTLDKYAHAVPGGDARASATLRQILTVGHHDARATRERRFVLQFSVSVRAERYGRLRGPS